MNRRERTQSPTPRFRRKIWGPKLSAVEIDETIGPSDSSNSLDEAGKRNGESYLASSNAFRQTDLHSLFGMLPDDATQGDSDGIFSDSDKSIDTKSDEKSDKVPSARKQIRLFSKSNEIMQRKMEEVALSEAMSGVGRRDRHARATAVVRSRSTSIVRKKYDRTSDDNNQDGTKGADGHISTKRGASRPPSSKPGLVMRGLVNLSKSVEDDVEQQKVPTISSTRLCRSSSVPRRFPPKITRFFSDKEYPTSPFSAFNVVSPRESNVETDSPDIPHPIAVSSPQYYESLILLSECASPDSPSRGLIQLNSQSSPAYSPSNSQSSTSSRDVTDSPAASTPNWISSNSSCDIPDPDISKPSKHASPGRSIDTSVTSVNSITSIDESSQDESTDNLNCDTAQTERSHSQDCMLLPNQQNQSQLITTINLSSHVHDLIVEKETRRIQTGGASTPRTALLEKCGWTHHHRFARHRSAGVNPTSPKIVRLNHVSSAVIVDANCGKNLVIPKESVGIQTGSSLDELDGKYDLVTDASTNEDDVTNAVRSEVYEAMAAELADLRAWKEEALATTDKYADEVETLNGQLQILANQCDEQQKLLREKKTEISTLESKLRQESSSLNAHHDELAVKTKENQDLRQRLALLNAAKYDAEAEVEALKSERKVIGDDMKMRDLNARHLRESNEKLKKEAASLMKDITKWRAKADEFEDAQVQLKHLEITLEGKCEENQSLHERVRELEADLEKRRSESWRSNARIDILQDKVHEGLIKIDSLSDELENLQEENKNLHAELEEKTDESRSLENPVMAFRKSQDEVSTKVTERDELSCEVKELMVESDPVHGVIATFKEELKEAEESSNDNEAFVASLKSERDEMSTNNFELSAENERVNSLITALEKDRDEAMRLCHASTAKCPSFEDMVVSLKSERDKLTSKVPQLASKNERVRDDLTSIVASKDEETSSCCSKIARIESEFMETKKTLELKTAALQNLKVQLSESQSIICEKEEMILALELDLDKISSQASAQLSEINELRNWRSIAEETMAKQGNELATLRSAVAKTDLLEATIEKLAKEVAIKESEASYALDDLSKKDKSIASLQVELHDAVSRRDQLLQEVKDLNDWKESARQNINNLQSEGTLNASEIDRLARELSQRKKEVSDLQSSIVNLEIKVAEKISTIAELSGLLKSREDEIFSLRSEVDAFVKKEVTVTQEIDQLHEQNNTANNIISDLEAKLHEESHNVVTFRQELEKSKESCLRLEDEITMLMDEIQFLHESMHTKQADFDRVLQLKNSESDALRAENFGLLESIKSLNEDIQNMEDTHRAQLIERHNVKRELEASNAEKENKISSLHEELKKATEQLNTMHSKALSMSLITGPLSSEISELRELKYAADKNMEKQAEVVDELKKQVFNLTSQCDEKSECLANKEAELLEIKQKFHAESLSKAEIVSRFEDELLQKSKLIDKLSTGQKHAITHFQETLGKMTDKLTEKEEECERLRNEFERREKMIGDLVAQLSELNEEKLSMAQNALEMATEFEEKIFNLQLNAERAHILEGDLERERSKYDQARKALEALEKTLMTVENERIKLKNIVNPPKLVCSDDETTISNTS